MNKPPFDPSKAFEVVDESAAPTAVADAPAMALPATAEKPPFDPSKPFEAADEAAPSAAWPSQVDAPPEPSGTLAEKATNVVQRLADATKNTILPTSVEAAKQTLDPRAGRAGLSRLAEEEAARVEGVVKGAKANIDAKLAPFNDALDAAGVRRPHPLLFKALGSDLATDMAAPMLRPSAWQEALGGEAMGPAAELAPGVAGIKALAKGAATGADVALPKSMVDAAKAGLALHSENFAVDMGRRALGYTKRFFKKPEDAARANDVAREMLSQMVKDPESGAASKIISPSTDAMLQRAQFLSDKAGQQIGQIFDHLDASGVRSVHPDQLVDEVVTQLDPGKTGGRYDRIKSIVQEIKDTINAHETDAGQMSFGEAQQLKNTLRDAAKFNMVSDETSANLYRRAYGIVREAVDKSVGNAEAVLGEKGTGILKEYLDSKGIYGKAEEALGAITNKLGTELGNNIIGLRETIVAAEELMRGHPVRSAIAAGSKAVTQKGPAIAARVASSLAKYLRTVRPSARPAILKALVNTGTLSVARKYYNEFADRGIHLPKEPYKKKVDQVNSDQAYYDNPMLQFGETALKPLGDVLKSDIEDPKSMLQAQADYMKQDPQAYAMGFAGQPMAMSGLPVMAAMAEFKGLKSLTTPILEMLKGKETVSKQFIEDAIKMPGVKQAEQNMVKNVLQHFSGDKVDANEFAKIMKGEFLPLKATAVKNPQYHRVNLTAEEHGFAPDYAEHVYTSPIHTSAGSVHFENGPKNYFAHTRSEDVGGSGAGTRRILELQSDLFQKGNLEREADRVPVIPGLKYDSPEALQLIKDKQQGMAKLKPFENTWPERIVQEEIRRAAKDGKTLLQLPTGETAMKIEGLGVGDTWQIGSAEDGGERLAPEHIKIGQTIHSATQGDEWVVTDVLGNGKFKAVPKHDYKDFKGNSDFLTELKETFDVSGRIDKDNPIYKFYEHDVHKILKKLAPDVQRVKDKQGVEWYQLKVDPKKAKEPVFNLGTPLRKGA